MRYWKQRIMPTACYTHSQVMLVRLKLKYLVRLPLYLISRFCMWTDPIYIWVPPFFVRHFVIPEDVYDYEFRTAGVVCSKRWNPRSSTCAKNAKLGSEMLPGKKLRKRHTPPEIPSLTQMLSLGQRSYFDESEYEEDDFHFFADSEVRALRFRSLPVWDSLRESWLSFLITSSSLLIWGNFEDPVRTISGQHVTTMNDGYQSCRVFIWIQEAALKHVASSRD